jgi:hypothetical protein
MALALKPTTSAKGAKAVLAVCWPLPLYLDRRKLSEFVDMSSIVPNPDMADAVLHKEKPPEGGFQIQNLK